MKLIDPRAVAIEIAEIMAYEANMEYDGAGYHYTKNDYIEVAESWFKNVPSIEAEPVRRGRWVPHDCSGRPSIDKDVCSVCGNRFTYIAETGCTWNFCPNCGAKMEEGK